MEQNEARAVLVDISKVPGLDSCIRGRRNAVPFQCLSGDPVRIQILAAGRSWLRLALAGQACLRRNAEEIGRTDPRWER